MADAPNFAKLVPGFDFLQALVKNAGSALPSIGQWVAPTLNPDELEKRIEELRTVQFWLEQNARMLGATIQALEVQRMTLSTLKTMNVQMEDLRDSLMIRLPERRKQRQRRRQRRQRRDAGAGARGGSAARPRRRRAGHQARAANAAKAAAPAGVIDPMQWWGALTKQFTQLAADAMKDSATDAAKGLATSMVKQSFDAAGRRSKNAVAAPAKVAKAKAGGAAASASAAG